jgi:hypothetical protein
MANMIKRVGKIYKESNLNLNPHELGFYHSNRCRATVAITITPEVLQPSPLKEISSRDYEGREVIGEQRTVIDRSLGLSNMKVGVITFLILGLGTCLLSTRTLQTKTRFGMGSALTTTAWRNG